MFIFLLTMDEMVLITSKQFAHACDDMKCISGGTKGFTDVVWKVKSHKKDSHITFEYNSFDNEQGTYVRSWNLTTRSLLIKSTHILYIFLWK